MTRPLILMNGRGYVLFGTKSRQLPAVAEMAKRDPRALQNAHGFVAAYSMADAARLIEEFNGGWPKAPHELRHYWSKGCWGKPMDGITPERGVWVQFSQFGPREKPVRLA